MSIFRSRFFFWAAITIPPSFYISYKCRRLEQMYPCRPAHPSSPLYDANSFSSYVPDAKVFYARIPRSVLIGSEIFTPQSLNDLWARAFTSNPTILLEARLIGLWKSWSWSPGDYGERGFFKSQQIFNGLMTVLQAPTDYDPLLYEWTMPSGAVHTADRLASYGLPWRLMSGGGQEVQALVEEGRGEWVEVSFGCAQSYERRNSVNGKEDGKLVPRWFEWIHEMYARWLLDSTVRMLMRREQERGSGSGRGGWKARIPDLVAVAQDAVP